MVYVSAACIVAYGWVMDYRTAPVAPMAMLFFTGHCTTGAFTTLSTLVADVHCQGPATAVAANNLARCLLAAGVAAVASPVIDRIGLGWTATGVAGIWFCGSRFVGGYQWRVRA
ncbi:hypothetical protein EYZ11_003871 [Aspergillus tanneri]|nr:hypothetical protein EYZ11_003871 [Aspergillus tanneri]